MPARPPWPYSLSLLASLLICCGCERPLFNRAAGTSSTESNDEWRTHGCFGGKGQGISLIAVCPRQPGEPTTYDPFIATADALLDPLDVHRCMIVHLGGSVKLWGQPDYEVELLSTFVPRAARDLRFTPDGRGLAYACGEGVIIWHIGERRFETRLSASEDTWFELSTDCRWIVRIECGDDQQKTITVFDFETTEPRGTISIRSGRCPLCHISSDGSRLSTVLYEREPGPPTAVVFNLETRARELSVPIDDGTNYRAAWSASGKILAAPNATDDIIQIWDMAKGELRSTAGKQSKIRCVAISPDERLVITGGEGEKQGKAAGEVVIWDARTGRELGRHWDESSWGVTALAITEKGMLMIGNGDGYVILKKIPDRILAQVMP